jgi:hypothetical protein
VVFNHHGGDHGRQPTSPATAICRDCAGNFNAIRRPATVLVREAEAIVVRRAETIEDVFRRDLGFLPGDPAERQRQHAGE